MLTVKDILFELPRIWIVTVIDNLFELSRIRILTVTDILSYQEFEYWQFLAHLYESTTKVQVEL